MQENTHKIHLKDLNISEYFGKIVTTEGGTEIMPDENEEGDLVE